MTVILRNIWQFLMGGAETERQRMQLPPARPRQVAASTIEIAPDDPIIAYFQSNPNVAEIARLNLDSPALQAMRAADIQLIVPLVSQGELIGLLNLGPHLSEQNYSIYDRRLLENLASQAAPALRVAQLVRQQQAEVQARERLEQELRVARLIQQTLLPKEAPTLPGWQVATYYQPAREIGGDFYDFLYFPDGRLGLIVGDVTDKGMPAALVMATTRTLLRAVAQQLILPGQVLERVNDLLYPDIPPKMFVTCLYALLDPATGRLQYANAGHNLPYRQTEGSVTELRATGMVLGMMPGMHYEEKEVTLAPNETVLFYTDGLVEAHNLTGEMFSYPRLRRLIASHPVGGAALIDLLLTELETFTGAHWEQEDDVTLVTLERVAPPASSLPGFSTKHETNPASLATSGAEGTWRSLAEFIIASEPGNETQAMQRVIEAVQELHLSKTCTDRLKTAVAEATMNAIEHGHQNRPELLVQIQVLASDTALVVRVADQGGGWSIPEPAIPDLKAKLAGLQPARGWGLFLIKNLMDELHVTCDETHHTLELIMYLEGDRHASPTV